MKIFFSTFLLLITSTFNSFATFQKPDLLIIEKDTFKIYTYPLEQYFHTKPTREILGLTSCVSFSTACYRGYQAVWKIENGKIYLVAIKPCHINSDCKVQSNADLKTMFGEKFKSGGVLADWYTDSLAIPIGDKLQYTPLGYPTVVDKEKLIVIANGQIVSVSEFQNIFHNQKRLSRFNYSNWHDTIFELLNTNFNWTKIPKDDDDWSFENVILTVTKDGHSKIDFRDNLEKVYADEIQKILKILKWEIAARFGKPYESEFRFEVYFDIKKKKIVDKLSKVSD